MALGNSNTTAQARGKNTPVKVIRNKEVREASGFTAFQGSALQGSDACSLDNGDVNITYYHAGNGVLPQVGDKIYFRQQLNDRFLVDNDKHFKVGPDRGRYFNVNYRGGVVASVSAC
jgi:hypothetical protein